MERSHGEEGVESKCRKDKGHDHRRKSRSDLISWRWKLPSATWVTCFGPVEAMK